MGVQASLREAGIVPKIKWTLYFDEKMFKDLRYMGW